MRRFALAAVALAAISSSTHQAEAEAFVAYVLSPRGRAGAHRRGVPAALS